MEGSAVRATMVLVAARGKDRAPRTIIALSSVLYIRHGTFFYKEDLLIHGHDSSKTIATYFNTSKYAYPIQYLST